MQRYVSLINIGGDYCGVGHAEEYPDYEHEDELGQSRASNEVWVRASEAQSEIARLQAEVERLRGVVRKRTEEADDADYRAYTAWNDAIDAAYSAAELYPDLDYGESYRDAFIHGCMAARDAIRALRKDQP